MPKTIALTARQRRDLEAELLAERARLERVRLVEPDTGAELITDAGFAAATQSALGVAVHGRARARYDAIKEALDRLAAGTYGACASCGDQIPYGRLIVMPEATHCVGCPPAA